MSVCDRTCMWVPVEARRGHLLALNPLELELRALGSLDPNSDLSQVFLTPEPPLQPRETYAPPFDCQTAETMDLLGIGISLKISWAKERLKPGILRERELISQEERC